MSNICPSVFYLRLSPPLDSSDTFDRFEIKDGRNLTYVSNIKTNIDITTAVRLLCCHHVKGMPDNYCTTREKKDASTTACSLRTKWTHFHLSPEIGRRNSHRIEDEDYLLSFVENLDFSPSISDILEEQIDIVKTLGIRRPVRYYIFTYGEPSFTTSTPDNIEHIFGEAIKTVAHKAKLAKVQCPSADNCNFEKIGRSEKNDLSFSLNNRRLVFSSS
jgi:hypothetical protein